jgi:ATP-dependent helicase/nuclease subunit A
MTTLSNTLTIYRSSAGAGKTYTLVSEYINLALAHPNKFTQILAVTFTNQATQEMRQRILASLYDLAQGKPTPMAIQLLNAKGWGQPMLQERAQLVLCNILHHYARFSVCTIDSFFQKVVREFARELGLRGSFRVELDQNHVLEHVIDEVVASADQHPHLNRWLTTFAGEKLLAGKSWNIKRALMLFSQALFSEDFSAHASHLVQTAEEEQTFSTFHQALQKQITHFEHTLQALGQQALDVIQRAGLDVKDFAYGNSGPAGYLVGMATRRRWKPTQRALHASESIEAWLPKTSSQPIAKRIIHEELQPCLHKALRFYEAHQRLYHTALEVKHFMYALGIASHVLRQLNDYRAKHNIMLVSDITALLRQVIAENDVPFVYEKVGAFYNHFLIDEFQDISRFQWDNLKPLLADSIDAGHASLVVGDVKQSIYRWRGGDWRLLLTQLEADFKQATAMNLSYNWRSKSHIIDFNNHFFASSSTVLVQHLTDNLSMLEEGSLKEELNAYVRQLGAVYHGVAQRQPIKHQQDDKGYVQITFVKDTDHGVVQQSWRDAVKERLPVLVESLQRDGYALKDIALLVRSNAEGREVIQTLLAYQQSSRAQSGYRYDVVSRESLYLSHSPWINILINALRYLYDASNTLALIELQHLYQVYVLHVASDVSHAYFQADVSTMDLPAAFSKQSLRLQQLPLYELVVHLITIFALHRAEATPFLQAFQDLILAFIRQEEADIGLFLNWWNTKGHQHTLPRAANQDAMSLMTIHQAKGLQFKVVIVPFCAWDLDHGGNHPPTLWCTASTTPFDHFPVLPLRYTSRLKATLYAREYYEEQMQAYLDHFNLLYVAFTRPEDRLYAFAQHPAKAALKTTADLLYHTFTAALDTTNMPVIWKRAWDDTTGTFEMRTT